MEASTWEQADPAIASKDEALLSVQDLTVRFRTKPGVVTALSHVTFSVRAGEKVSIVESVDPASVRFQVERGDFES